MRKSPGSRPRPRRPNHGATAARMTSTTRTVSSHFNMIELYTWSTPNGRKVSIMLEECGLPYRVHKIDIGKGDQFTPEYVAINPNSKIPSIVDPEGPDGEPLALMESGAILVYLAGKTGKFLPPTSRGQYDALQWLMFQMGGVGPSFGQAHHVMRAKQDEIPYGSERYGREAVYMILSGKVKVYVGEEGGKEIPLDVKGPGQYFGEMTLDDKPRAASVMSLQPSRLAEISGADVRALLLKHPETALHLIRNLIRVTRGLNERARESGRKREKLRGYIDELGTKSGADSPDVKRWAKAKRWILAILLVCAVLQYYFFDVFTEMMSLGGVNTFTGN